MWINNASLPHCGAPICSEALNVFRARALVALARRFIFRAGKTGWRDARLWPEQGGARSAAA